MDLSGNILRLRERLRLTSQKGDRIRAVCKARSHPLAKERDFNRRYLVLQLIVDKFLKSV